MNYEWNGNRDPHRYDEYYAAGFQYRAPRKMPAHWWLDRKENRFERLVKWLWKL